MRRDPRDDYFDGDDPAKGDTWPDEDISDESPEAEIEMTRDKQARLAAALRQARADEGEDEMEDGESEDGESEYARAGMADSRRGASQQDDSEQEDDAEQEDEDEARGDMADDFRKKLLRLRASCAECGEAATVSPPKGYAFQKLSEMRGDEEEAKVSNRLRWQCKNCEASNRLTLSKHRLVRRRRTAAEAFRASYYGRRSPSPGLDAIATFRESYHGNSDLAHWKECRAQYPG